MSSDVDLYVKWPDDLNEVFTAWWLQQNDRNFEDISLSLGARAEILDPDDKEMQRKIVAAGIVEACGCAMAVTLPRIKAFNIA